MADERVFLNERDIYVSNTRVILTGTTYATSNITSVAERVTPPSQGCAVVLIIVGALGVLFALGSLASTNLGEGLGALLLTGGMVAGGIAWLRSLRPTYHVVLASASGEREGLSSQNKALVDRVVAAISDAITFRG